MSRENDEVTKMIRVKKPHGGRKRGRPKRRMDCAERDLGAWKLLIGGVRL